MSKRSFEKIKVGNSCQNSPQHLIKENNDNLNCTLCILCQEDKKKKLHCPVESKRSDYGAGYKKMAENIQGFFDVGSLPFNLKQDQLDDGSGIYSKTRINGHHM